MRVFISHKSTDSLQALKLAAAFAKNGIRYYLDVLDGKINGDGRELTEHIKQNLNECTDIIVVMSEATKTSWWVPFEIGMSAQVDMPTASFLKGNVEMPSYLSYWPRLKTESDVDKYVAVREKTRQIINEQCTHTYFADRKATETRAFYDALKRELR